MEFVTRAIELVVMYYNNRVGKDSRFVNLTADEVYLVWFSYSLGNWKTLLSTTKQDAVYYEVTYDKNLRVTYIDAYKKFENVYINSPA